MVRWPSTLAVNIPGDLHVAGMGLARGYFDRPELTAERFIPNPFQAANPAQNLYKTGDLARYLSDGNIEFLGRLDQQVVAIRADLCRARRPQCLN